MIDQLYQQTLDRIAEIGPPRRAPISTYRLQLHAKFTFRDAIAIFPYLRDLGITHVYCSPYLKATPGSMHGYDVIDHCRLNDEIGSEADYAAFVAALRDHGLQQILDTVPNHVGVGTNENHWWNEVLANGPSSKYANYFDITWQGSPRRQLHDKVLLPLLGQPYAEVLEKGELKLVRDPAGYWVQYYDRKFPLSPESAREIGNVADYAGTPGNAASFDKLDALLNRQHYRLAWWESAPDEINYRRFFDVNSLAALRMDRPEVFEQTHALTLSLLADGRVAGLRIDHPDGLANPKQYFDRLQQYYFLAVAKTLVDSSKQDWEDLRPKLADKLSRSGDRPLYVVVEKILAMDEPLPADWAVSGTTGYDFLALVNALYTDPSAEKAMTDLYARFTGSAESFEDLVYQKKRLILDISLASELRMLATQLAELAQKNRRSIDFTVRALQAALGEAIASFPVYRSYVRPGHVDPQDVQYVNQAIDAAIDKSPAQNHAVLNYLRDVLLLRYPPDSSDDLRSLQNSFVERFQQLTSPTTAKGIEDTSFYIYNRLTSLNEVGGNPGRFSVSPGELHRYFQSRQHDWAGGLSPLTTHDTKRSEDVRARISALSEMPADWRSTVESWHTLNESLRRPVAGGFAPAPDDEYLLYQTILGAWPMTEPSPKEHEDFVSRIDQYLLKAMREAKVNTTWTHPVSDYEEGVKGFTHDLLDRQKSKPFFDTFLPLAGRLRDIGIVNSLSQTLLRLTAPGVPDTYQGSEWWDLSLVDPDNRRPVDYPSRQVMLKELKQQWPATDRPALLRKLWDTRHNAGIKLLLIWRLLEERRAKPALFTAGDYLPLTPAGAGAEHLFAFLRRLGSDTLLVIAPRLTAGWGPFPWAGQRYANITLPGLPTQPLRHLLTNQPYSPATALADYPVGIYASW